MPKFYPLSIFTPYTRKWHFRDRPYTKRHFRDPPIQQNVILGGKDNQVFEARKKLKYTLSNYVSLHVCLLVLIVLDRRIYSINSTSVYQFSELSNNHKFLGNQSRFAVAVLGRS